MSLVIPFLLFNNTNNLLLLLSTNLLDQPQGTMGSPEIEECCTMSLARPFPVRLARGNAHHDWPASFLAQ